MPDRTEKTEKAASLRAAFVYTLPVLAGFIFLGLTYGILMSQKGFPIYLSLLMSALVYAGSMQFVAINLLAGAFSPLEAFLITLMINARHVFYGISMLDKYKGKGFIKPYLIFGMSDETFSINYTAKLRGGKDEKYFMFFVTLLNHAYWVIGTAIGAIFGSLVSVPIEGIDFVMCSMFAVVFFENLRGGRKTVPSSLIGLLISLASLLIFGKDSFIIPAMIGIVIALAILKTPIEKRMKTSREGES